MNFKIVLALVFTILLFSWFLSVIPQRDGFDPRVPDIEQKNFLHIGESTRDIKRIENMDDEESDPSNIQQRLAMLEGTSPSAGENNFTEQYSPSNSGDSYYKFSQ